MAVTTCGITLSGCGTSTTTVTTARSIPSPSSTSTTLADSSTTTPNGTGSSPSSAGQGVPLGTVEWSRVTYPVECGTKAHPLGYRVLKVSYSNPAPHRQAAIVLVNCNTGAGTPPVDLFVYSGASTVTAPRLLQVLISSRSKNYQANGFTVSGSTITMAAASFSSAQVPQCCPNVHSVLHWTWNGDMYRLL